LVLQRLLEHDIRQREGVDVTSLLDVVRTPEYGPADPRVSVLVPLHNHATEVIDALESVAASGTLWRDSDAGSSHPSGR
jgi:hypothetical protein